MSFRYMQAVKIVCDQPDCKVESVDLSGEYAFWMDESDAETEWDYGDGVALKNGSHFCPGHRPPECAGCGELEGDAKLVNDEPGDEGDWWCPTCMKDNEREETP